MWCPNPVVLKMKLTVWDDKEIPRLTGHFVHCTFTFKQESAKFPEGHLS